MKPTRDPQPVILVGARLRALRKQRRITQQAVADRLNIHRTTYNKYEAGTVAPDQQGLVRLSEIFGVSVDYLLGCENTIPELSVADSGENRHILSLQEQTLLQMFRQLSAEEQERLLVETQQNLRQLRNGK